MIYEYSCEACEHEFEAHQSIKDEPLKKCPKCNKDKLKKLISLSTFVLKGNCWERDGYQ